MPDYPYEENTARVEEAAQVDDKTMKQLVAMALASNDAITVQTLDGTITVWNKGAEKMYGYTSEEAVGRNIDMLVPKEEQEQVVSFVEQMVLSVSVDSFETRRVTKDGKILNVWLTATVSVDEEGIPCNILTTERDITARKRTEAILAEHAAELARSNHDLEQFAYIASHDLQEPLRKVQAFGDRLKNRYEDKLDEIGLDYLERMLSASHRMQTLIYNLLEFSRISTVDGKFVNTSLSEEIKQVLSDLEIRINETGAKITVSDMPVIKADPVRIRQLFQNLIGNALKFIDEKTKPEIKIFAKKIKTERNKDLWEIHVKDNGIGIDKKYSERVFEIFQRLHGRDKYGGTGIGLAICRRICMRHGGDIRVFGEKGKGSDFVIYLPVKRKKQENKEHKQ